ncbi:MAG: glycosyltransferase family 4 protein [Flavobacteriales bacterium]|nr:glycosyltransferase family 4 protein [Flavobacteriales bacterium]
MLTIVTNIPTPYRTAFFNVLNVELNKQNINFHVIYCAKTEPRRFWKFNNDENHYNYTFLNGFHPEFKNFYPHFNFDLIKKLKDLKPNWILMAGSWNSPSVINILLHKNKLKSTLLFWSEGHIDAQRNKNKFIDKLRGIIFKKFDAFVVPNHKSELYVRNYNSNASVGFLPNTIDEAFFCIDDFCKNTIRHKLEIPAEAILVCLISTLNDRKGVVEFMEGYNLLSKIQKEKIYVLQIGEGEFMEKLVTYKKINNLNNYFIMGQRDQLEVKECLIASDFFALPTKLDPNPLTPIEASFLKKPLLLSRKAGNINELLLPENKNGFILNEINKEEVYKSLLNILELDREIMQKMGENSYQNVIKNFSRESASQNLIKFLKSVLR